jgi:hypothetical protein
MQFVNLTPEVINLVYDAGDNWIASIPPSGKVARVSTNQESIGKLAEWPVWGITSPKVVDLPEPKEGFCYLVSKEVAQLAKRHDVLVPDIEPVTLRNGEKVMGVCGFLSFS